MRGLTKRLFALILVTGLLTGCATGQPDAAKDNAPTIYYDCDYQKVLAAELIGNLNAALT